MMNTVNNQNNQECTNPVDRVLEHGYDSSTFHDDFEYVISIIDDLDCGKLSLVNPVGLHEDVDTGNQNIHKKNVQNINHAVHTGSYAYNINHRDIQHECIQHDERWSVNCTAKKAVLAYLRYSSFLISSNNHRFKVQDKFAHWTSQDYDNHKIRICPPSHIKYSAYIGDGCVLMPCFINIGAHVGANTMIDTWATVGSCAYVGENVHISGGVGIGGVLEPAQATPTIIEDNCFIGARSEIVEGVVVRSGAVISMGVFIGKSTKIVCRDTNQIFYGYVPENAVVIPGSLRISDTLSQNCAIIVKYADQQTRDKTAINDLLRDIK